MLLLGVGAFFTFIGMYVPMVYIGVYSLEKDITGPTLAFYLLPILQAASIFGRIIPVSIFLEEMVLNSRR